MGLVAHSGDARLNGAVPGFQQPTSRGHRERALVRHAVGGQARRHLASGAMGFPRPNPHNHKCPRPSSDHASPGLCILGHRVYDVLCVKGRRKGAVRQPGPGLGSSSEHPDRIFASSGQRFLPPDVQSSRHLGSSVLRSWRGDVSGAISGVAREEISVDDAIGGVWGNPKTA